jgi:glyoxylate/succinic semialdehyde reductase
MASRLLAAQGPASIGVTVWNRSGGKAEPLRALGARVAATPAEVTATCDVVFAMLADPEAARAVAMVGPDSAVAGISSRASTLGPATYVDCSTVDAATGQAVGAAVLRAAMGTSAGADGTRGGFLAAPVSGGWRDARDGKLLFLCGGSQSAYDAASQHGLDAMGTRRWLVGPSPGDAARAKLMLQVMMGRP